MNSTELLQKALAQGIIDVATIQAQIEMNERKRFLEMHKNKVWQGKNGCWYTELPATPDRKRRLVKKKKQEDLEEEIINYYRTEEEHPTVRAVFEEWIKTKQEWEEITKNTADRYRVDFNKYLEGTELAGTRIDLVEDYMLEAFIKDTIVKQELTTKAYSNLKTLLLGILKFAKNKRYTKFSASVFFKDLQISKKTFKQKQKKKQVFTIAEAQKVIKWLQDNPSVENYGILLVFQTGIREGELAALKHSDVEGNTLHIQRQEIRYKSDTPGVAIHEVVEYTKTAAGDRHVILTDSAKAILKELRKMNPFGEYMLMKDGKRINKQNYNDYLYKACQECGIEKLSMHKIRKTYGTLLIDGGADDSTVMEQMGHSDISTTRKYYYFCNKDQDEKEEQVKRAIII